MEVTKTSMLSGKVRTLDLDITTEQINRWKAGEFIQSAMPHLTSIEREFLISGITAEEWGQAFPIEEEKK